MNDSMEENVPESLRTLRRPPVIAPNKPEAAREDGFQPGKDLVAFLIIAAGILGLLFLLFIFGVGVGSVANLDKLNLRLCGVIVCVGMILSGGLLMIIERLDSIAKRR